MSCFHMGTMSSWRSVNIFFSANSLSVKPFLGELSNWQLPMECNMGSCCPICSLVKVHLKLFWQKTSITFIDSLVQTYMKLDGYELKVLSGTAIFTKWSQTHPSAHLNYFIFKIQICPYSTTENPDQIMCRKKSSIGSLTNFFRECSQVMF